MSLVRLVQYSLVLFNCMFPFCWTNKWWWKWWRKSLYVHTAKDFHLTCNMLLYYLVKFKNPKMLPNVYV